MFPHEIMGWGCLLAVQYIGLAYISEFIRARIGKSRSNGNNSLVQPT